MPTWLAVILEIVKITVPALIVFFTVYYLIKTYLEKEYQVKALEYKQEQIRTTVPLRLQAYERLSLFCERITIPSLVLRVRNSGMTALDLRLAMMVAIQQEFEHNITQQVYVSNQLWQIIQIARDDTVNVMNVVYQQVDAKADAQEYIQHLFKHWETREGQPLQKALQAIKKEAGLLM